MTDEELLTKYLQTKDHELFAVLDEKMRTRLFALAYSKVHSRDDAEDIVQDVFLRLMEIEPDGKDIKSAENFLFRITNNLIIDFQRIDNSGIRNGMVSLDSLANSELFDSDDYDSVQPLQLPDKETILTKSEARALDLQMEARVAMEVLPQCQKASVELYHCRGMTANETAEALGISESTVEKRAENGIKQLRKVLGVKNRTHPSIRPLRAINADGDVVHEFEQVVDARAAGYNLGSVYRSMKRGKTYRGLNWSYATAV